nr:threonine aldolase [Bacteroidota bacterium]
VMGGGWRQAGLLAAAGIYALDNNMSRLKADHQRAKEIGKMLKGHLSVKNVYPIDTNIVIFEMPTDQQAKEFIEKAAKIELKCVSFGKNLVRFVTHLDFTDEHLSALEKRLSVIFN